MRALIDPQTEVRELASRARALLQEVREAAAAHPDGTFFNKEDQEANTRKTQEAMGLLAEAKAKRKAFDEAQAAANIDGAALENLEREAANLGLEPGELLTGAAGSIDDIMNGRSGGHRKAIAGWNPFKQSTRQLLKASPSVMSFPLIENVVPHNVREGAKDLARQAMRENASSVVQREIAALVEGTQANGGFLVVPQYMQDLFAAVRRQGNALRRAGLLNIHQTEETNQILFPRASGALTVGLVAELAVKPTADNNYSQVTVGLYTMAGIASLSRQLARSADPVIAQILARDLAMLLGNLEEQLIYSGTGTQQPRGIINTTGTTATTAMTAGSGSGAAGVITGQDVIDAMIDTAARIATAYYGPPTAAVMRPSRLAFLQKTKDTAGNYVLNRSGSFRAPAMSEAEDVGGTDSYDVLGFPLIQSTNAPANLGGGANQDAIIMADWEEAHWFQRWDQQLDSSDIASDGAGNSSFATNRILFRLEQIAGFSAERYPAAFSVITGTGMVSAY